MTSESLKKIPLQAYPGCVENDYIQIKGILEIRHDCVLPLYVFIEAKLQIKKLIFANKR